MKQVAMLNNNTEGLSFVLPSSSSWAAATLFFSNELPYYCVTDEENQIATVYLSRNASLDLPLSFYNEVFTSIRDLPDDYDYFAPNPDKSMQEILLANIKTGEIVSTPVHMARSLLTYAPVFQAVVPETPSMLRIAIEDRLERDQFVQLQKNQIVNFDLGAIALSLRLFRGQVFQVMDDPYENTFQIDTGRINLAFKKSLLDNGTMRFLPRRPDGYQWDTDNDPWYDQTCQWADWDPNRPLVDLMG